jgi:hypothetical protein
MKLKEEFGEEKNSKGVRGGRKLEEGNKPWLFFCSVVYSSIPLPWVNVFPLYQNPCHHGLC